MVRSLLRAVDDLDDDAGARLANDVERVTILVDDVGQAALYGVAQNPDQLDTLQNSYERSLWMFLRDPVGFRHAEEVRFTDERRRGRSWDGFLGEPNLVCSGIRSPSTLSKSRSARGFRRTTSISISSIGNDRPLRDRICVGAGHVYREGRLDTLPEFVNGLLDRRPWRPVFEAASPTSPRPVSSRSSQTTARAERTSFDCSPVIFWRRIRTATATPQAVRSAYSSAPIRLSDRSG